MKRLTACCLKERITFLKRVISETEVGDYEEKWQEVGQAWAMVKPIPTVNQQQDDAWHVVDEQKAIGLYRVAMRKCNDRNALHAGLRAITWKGKILNILSPFQLSQSVGFVEAVVADHGKINE